MKWVHYFLCFLGGVFLIHIVPHMMHGWSRKNAMGVAVSLVGGCLLLWAGRFRWQDRGKVAMVVLGHGYRAGVWLADCESSADRSECWRLVLRRLRASMPGGCERAQSYCAGRGERSRIVHLCDSAWFWAR